MNIIAAIEMKATIFLWNDEPLKLTAAGALGVIPICSFTRCLHY
jgi:hypothetical protein